MADVQYAAAGAGSDLRWGSIHILHDLLGYSWLFCIFQKETKLQKNVLRRRSESAEGDGTANQSHF